MFILQSGVRRAWPRDEARQWTTKLRGSVSQAHSFNDWHRLVRNLPSEEEEAKLCKELDYLTYQSKEEDLEAGEGRTETPGSLLERQQQDERPPSKSRSEIWRSRV